MLNGFGKSPYELAHADYVGKGWMVAYYVYDADDYSFDDGCSNVWTSKEDFEAFVQDPTSDEIQKLVSQNSRARHWEGYVTELYPIEIEFEDGYWSQKDFAESANYICKDGEWTRFFE